VERDVATKPTQMANPFEFGRAMRADAIVDREEELNRLTAAVRNGERLFLIGPRRYGKTSLLNYMQSQLERDRVIPFVL
jgi:predicted AAA+ superfamily ATPase